MNKPRLLILLLTIVAALAAGCTDKSDDGKKGGAGEPRLAAPRHPDGSGSAEVTYRVGVHVMEQDEGMRALIGVSTDGSTLLFDRARAQVPAMKDGEVVLIKGLLARKIVASMTNGNEFAVLTEPAGLPDLVSDAKIRLHAPIRFGAAPVVADASPAREIWSLLADAIISPARAQSPVEERRKAAEAKGREDAFGNLVQSPFKAVMSGWETEFRSILYRGASTYPCS